MIIFYCMCSTSNYHEVWCTWHVLKSELYVQLVKYSYINPSGVVFLNCTWYRKFIVHVNTSITSVLHNWDFLVCHYILWIKYLCVRPIQIQLYDWHSGSSITFALWILEKSWVTSTFLQIMHIIAKSFITFS
jgi:hypothetical protein